MASKMEDLGSYRHELSSVPMKNPCALRAAPVHPQNMVLAELGSKLATAMRSMTANTVIDEETVDNMLKDIASVRAPPLPCSQIAALSEHGAPNKR